MPLNVALIGSGPWARILFRNLCEHPDVVVQATVGRHAFVSEAGGAHAEVPQFDDWSAALETRGLQAVVIATRPSLNPEIIHAAWAKGLAVFAEKPLCLEVREAQRLWQFAQESAAAGFVPTTRIDHVHLFHPTFRELVAACRERLNEGARVPIRIAARAGGPGPIREYMDAWWDYGPHDVAMLLEVLGAWGMSWRDLRLTRVERTPVEIPQGRAQNTRVWMTAGAGDHPRVEVDLCVGNGFETKERAFCVEVGGRTLAYDTRAEGVLTRAAPLKVGLGEWVAAAVARKPLDLSEFERACGTVEILDKVARV